MKKGKFKNYFITILFLCILFIPMCTINLVQGKYSETEKRALVGFPKIMDQTTGNLSPTLKSDFSSWLNDNIGFRSLFVDVASTIQYKWFNKSPNSQVSIGKDGWFYYTPDDNLKIADETYPNFGDDELQAICEKQKIIQEKLANQGIDYVLMLPNSKVSIYPENIKGGNFDIIKTPSEILSEYLKDNSTVKTITFKDELLAEKSNQQLYFKTDTHWNEYGSYIGYKKIISSLNDYGILNNAKPVDVDFVEGQYKGEMAALMGNENLLPEEDCLKSVIKNPSASIVSQGQTFDKLTELRPNRYIGFKLHENTDKSLPKALIFGDSMFVSWNITELLAENFSEVTYVWSYNIQQEIIDEIQPDVVLYDMAERFLNTLPNKSVNFTTNILQTPKAEIVDTTAPTEFIFGQKYDFDVTVKNTGSESWSENDNVRLTILQNGNDVGYRVKIPYGADVEPGQTYTFKVKDYVVADNSVKYIGFQMLQEYVQYFGEKDKFFINGNEEEYSAEIVSQNAPTEIKRDKSYNIDITVKNSGANSWTEKDMIRLCIFQDGQDLGYRISLPEGTEVKPGETYKFTLEGFIAPPKDTTYLEFQMVQETVQYFGEKEKVDIKISK